MTPMSKPKIVSDYLEAAVPKGLTASRRKLLTDELESHIYDKAEHYIEIGYPEEESFEKAVAEMGDAEPVSESFRKLYKESHTVNILIMVLLIGINAVASYYNLGGNMVESMSDPNFMIVLLSLGYFSATVLLMKYAYGRKQTNKLAAVGASMLLVSIPSFFIGTVFVPGGYAVTENLFFLLEKFIGTDCINRIENHFTIPYILYTLGMPIVLSVISFVLSLKSACYESEKRFRLPYLGLKTVAAILVLFTLGNAVVYPFAREYEDSHFIYKSEESPASQTLTQLDSKIQNGDSRSAVLPLFKQAGMIPSDTFSAMLNAENNNNELETKINKMLQGKQNAELYFFSFENSEDYAFLAELPADYFLVEFDKNGKICGKEMSIDKADAIFDVGISSTDPEGLEHYCKRLKAGMSKQEVVDIVTTPACIKVFASASRKGSTVTEIQSYYAQTTKPTKTIFGLAVPSEFGGDSHVERFWITLVFENGVLKEQPETTKLDNVYGYSENSAFGGTDQHFG